MKHFKTRATALALVLCALLGLSACGGGGISEEDVTALVQGNIDVIYLNKYDSDYLEMVDGTEEEAEEAYLEGLEFEAEYFAYYWGIVDPDLGESYTDLDEGLRQDIVDLYDEIYSHSKYEVKDAVETDDGSYIVEVLIDPIDIMEQAAELYDNDGYEPLNEFWAKYADADYSAMTDEEYMDFTNEYGEVIVQLVRDQLPNLGYTEQESMVIHVEEDDDGLLTINEDDWSEFDVYVIYYPN